MRLILFLLKCVVGLLASIGFLLVAGAVLIAVFVLRGEPWKAATPEVPAETVLALDVSGGIVEARPDNPLAQISVGSALVMHDAVEALEAAGEDTRVRGLMAHLGSGELGIAQVQELRDAVIQFRGQGKFAVAFAESFGEGGNGTLHYYLASAFDEVWLQPSGNLDVTGFLVETPYLREALEKLGIEPRLGQREEYKGVMNMFTDRGLPEPQRRNLQQLVDSWAGQIARDVASDRNSDEAAIRATIDKAPYHAQGAVDEGLVDQLGYWDEMSGAVLERAGESAEFMDLMAYAETREPPPEDGPMVALIYGLGPVVLSGSESDPAFGRTVMGADTVAETISEAVEDDEIDAIVLRIDSPGGSYVASDAIWREVQLARDAGKPLIVSMSNVAASGGYFVAAPAHKIVALPGTVTGSIGVVSGKLVLSGFFDMLGINWDGVQAGDAAGFWSMNQDFSDAEWARLQDSLDRVYADFTGKVADGRGMARGEVETAAKGQVWSGEDARDLGLVDELGGLKRAFELAAEAAGAPGERVRVKILPEPRDPVRALIEDTLGRQIESNELSALLGDLRQLARLLAPLAEAMERLGGGSSGPRLEAPELRPVN